MDPIEVSDSVSLTRGEHRLAGSGRRVAHAPEWEEAPHDAGLTLLGFLAAILEHRWWIILSTLAALLLGLFWARLQPVTYSAESVVMPNVAEGQSSRMAGLAAQFGVSLGGGSQGGESLAFYADLLQSRPLLSDAALREYQISADEAGGAPRRGTLVELLGIQASPETAVRIAVGRLREGLIVEPRPTTGTIEIRTETEHPDLALAVNQVLLDLLQQFNLEKRRSQAIAEREFVQEQLEQARLALASSEDALRRFLEQHRNYEQSPQLLFEATRLERQVNMRQQLYLALSQSYEQAKIEAVRDAPVFTVIEPPVGSVRRHGPKYADAAILSGMLGAVVGILFVLVRTIFARQREAYPDEYARLVALRRSAARDFAPGRLLGRGRRERNGR